MFEGALKAPFKRFGPAASQCRRHRAMNGRPLVSREDFRERFGLYLSEVEAEQIRENAKAARLPMSTFVRRVALRKKIHVAQPLPHLDFCRRELAPLANNLNQIARACNA